MIITGKLDQPRPFGRFVLTNKIASGGMATVYLAEAHPGDPLCGRPLALKVLHAHLADSEDFLRMFRDEGHLAAKLDHPGVVRVFEVGEFEREHFLVMEFVDGRDLGQLLQAVRSHKTTVPASIVFEILRQALTALSYVHSCRGRNGKSLGIVHRDISPQNILISMEPKVKITDFGIARGLHRSDRTRTGTIKGKMHYMAPEQAAGHRVDCRADLYALGAVAFEMLTGQPAFGPAPTEVLHRRAIDGEVEFGAKFKAQPDDVKAWLRKSLARNVDERFQSADAMLAAMEQLVRASKSGFRPQALLALLALPEASRRHQREQRERPLFVGDDAIALGRAKDALVTSTATTGDRRPLPPGAPRSHVDLAADERNSRLFGKPVAWSGKEPELRPITESRAPSEPAKRARLGDVLPAERASGKNYAVSAAASAKLAAGAKPDRASEGSKQPSLAPHSFGAPAEPSSLEPVAAAKAAEPPAAPTTGSKISRAEADRRRGATIATASAWMCTAFILFTVLLEVVGWTPKLPQVDEQAVAAFFDEDAVPRPATDAQAVSPAHPAAPTVEAAKGPAASAAVAGVDGGQGDAGQADVRGAAADPAPEAQAKPQLDSEPAEPEAGPTAEERAATKARAEKRSQQLIDEGAVAELWESRPVERVLAPNAADPDKPAELKGRPAMAAAAAKPAVAGKPAAAAKPAVAGKPAAAAKPAVAGKPAAAAKPAVAGKPAVAKPRAQGPLKAQAVAGRVVAKAAPSGKTTPRQAR